MKNYLILKYTKQIKEYIFIFLTATIFLFTTFSKSFSEENIFTIKNVKIKGFVDLNFSRDKYLNKAFINSFEILMSKILLTRDLSKTTNIELKEVKKMIKSFQILEEKYKKNEYNAVIKIVYNDAKVKKFLGKKNISFSQPENVSAIFYPILFIDNKIQNFNENYFYKHWINTKIKNELIKFILPLEDIDDTVELLKFKNKIEEIKVDNFINKYGEKNYVFALMNYENNLLRTHLKINFNNNKISKNISHKISDIGNKKNLDIILKDLKLNITDLWKEENLINLLMSLSLDIHFEHKNINNFNKLKNTFKKISLIDNFTLEEFNTKNSLFKIYYFGGPKKLKSEFLKFGYKMHNEKGTWQLYYE